MGYEAGVKTDQGPGQADLSVSFERTTAVANRFRKVGRLNLDSNSLQIVVIGAGAAGLSASWLLSQNHRVTLVEQENRLGGHAHTAEVTDDPGASSVSVDTGFIVYNEVNYPNLVAWFGAMGVATENSDMSFAVSRDNGTFEYAGGPPLGLFAQPSLVLKRRFWQMLKDLLRFYREAPKNIPNASTQTLGEYLNEGRYSAAFIDDHLMPFGAAVWSTSRRNMLDYPAAAFIRFCDNHGLLKIANRPQWRTVSGGSKQYVDAAERRIEDNGGTIVKGNAVASVERTDTYVSVTLENGDKLQADQVVIATHADTALSLLSDPSEQESNQLGVFAYDSNRAVLHSDKAVMPKRRAAWCSWNYVEQENDDDAQVSVSYWMNRLQNLKTERDYFVSLNPGIAPDPATVVRESVYEHPIFNAQTWQAQQNLWSLQGQNNTWFCGSYFGAGFHEDAVQAGFAVAEQLGGHARGWSLDNPSDRIVVTASGASE